MAKSEALSMQAFEDYWALGPGRSLKGLVAHYRKVEAEGQTVPTRQLTTLKRWSISQGWQERIKQRVTEDAEELRDATKERALRVRRTMLEGLDENGRRFLARVRSGDVDLLSDLSDLQQFAKLFFALAGEPLVDRTEVTGAGGGPVELHHTGALDVLRSRLAQGDDATGEGDTPRDADG